MIDEEIQTDIEDKKQKQLRFLNIKTDSDKIIYQKAQAQEKKTEVKEELQKAEYLSGRKERY